MKYLIAVIFFLFSCAPQKTTPPTDDAVQQVIGSCITATIGTGDSARYFRKLLLDLFEVYREGTRRYNDSMKHLLDTAAVYLIVRDTLNQQITPDDQKEFFDFIYSYNHTQADVDSLEVSKAGIQLQIVDNQALQSTLHLPVKNTPQHINDAVRIIGRFKFLNVVFNNAKTKCAVYLDYYADMKSGYGEIFVLSKKNNTWMVTERQRTWIS